jgi:hypothetical protein
MRAMSKIKTLALILIAGFIHFCLMYKVIVDRLTCDVQPNCVSALNMFAGAVLSFPLGLVAWIVHQFDANIDVFGFIENLFVFYFINSILAVTLIWMVIVKPLVRLRTKHASQRQP